MAEPAVANKTVGKAIEVISELLGEYRPRDFSIELWDGSRWGPEPGRFCRFTWQIHHPGVLRALLRSDRQTIGVLHAAKVLQA